MNGTLTKDTKRNEAATLVAELFSVTPRYVRMVIADHQKKIYKGLYAEDIRRAYYKYLTGKENLIRRIKNNISTNKAA